MHVLLNLFKESFFFSIAMMNRRNAPKLKCKFNFSLLTKSFNSILLVHIEICLLKKEYLEEGFHSSKYGGGKKTVTIKTKTFIIYS